MHVQSLICAHACAGQFRHLAAVVPNYPPRFFYLKTFSSTLHVYPFLKHFIPTKILLQDTFPPKYFCQNSRSQQLHHLLLCIVSMFSALVFIVVLCNYNWCQKSIIACVFSISCQVLNKETRTTDLAFNLMEPTRTPLSYMQKKSASPLTLAWPGETHIHSREQQAC